MREGLTEDELELYDTLRKDKLTKDEEQKVKLAAKHLIARLLDDDLPESYDRITFKEKSDHVFDLIVAFAANGRKWAA